MCRAASFLKYPLASVEIDIIAAVYNRQDLHTSVRLFYTAPDNTLFIESSWPRSNRKIVSGAKFGSQHTFTHSAFIFITQFSKSRESVMSVGLSVLLQLVKRQLLLKGS